MFHAAMTTHLAGEYHEVTLEESNIANGILTSRDIFVAEKD